MIPLTGAPKESNSQTDSRGWWPGMGGGAGELAFHADRVSVWEGEKVLETDGGAGCTTV